MNIKALEALLEKANTLQGEYLNAETIVNSLEKSTADSFPAFVRATRAGAYGREAMFELPGVPRAQVLAMASKRRDDILAELKAINVEIL